MSGCLIILVDESAAMAAKPAQSDRPLSADAGTAINALLKQLGDGPNFPTAIIGYSSEGVGPRWAGSLAGRDFVDVAELSGAPLRTESRVRKIPGRPDESIAFPVWYDPRSSGTATQVAGFEFAANLARTAGPAIIVHVHASGSSDGNPAKIIKELTDAGATIFHAHLGTAAAVPATLFPANRAFLPIGTVRDTFDRTSPLSPEMIAELKSAQLVVNPGARGMVYNGRLTDLVRCLGLVKTHVKNWVSSQAAEPMPTVVVEDPPIPLYEPEPTSTPTMSGSDPSRLVVLVLDRSLNDPYSSDANSAFAKLQERANELLNKWAVKPIDDLQVSVCAYGMDAVGSPEVRTGFEGTLVGRPLVSSADLKEGALRVAEVTEEVPNGIGGLLAITRKKHTFLEMDPAAACPPGHAFQDVSGLIDAWLFDHPSPATPPMVLHLTRGAHAESEWREAVALVSNRAAVYHLIVTETGHPSVAYPESADELQTPELKLAWELSSPLAEAFPTNAAVKPGSRGLVVHGKFDALIAARS